MVAMSGKSSGAAAADNHEKQLYALSFVVLCDQLWAAVDTLRGWTNLLLVPCKIYLNDPKSPLSKTGSACTTREKVNDSMNTYPTSRPPSPSEALELSLYHQQLPQLVPLRVPVVYGSAADVTLVLCARQQSRSVIKDVLHCCLALNIDE